MDATTLFGATALGGALALAAPAMQRRWQLSRAKHRSLAGHARIARRLAGWLPGYAYDEAALFGADGAPPEVQARRRAAFEHLTATWHMRFARTLAATAELRDGLSDLQFTGRYRVPFAFSPHVRERLPMGAVVRATHGPQVEDLDGNRLYDLTGSYGVNLFGHDFYKACIAEAEAAAHDLGVVLGAYHPCVADNVQRLRALSGLDEVSFHMSGTEAVMQAVRLARYHTRRTHVVRFCGAYHGWWDDVQPGPGNPTTARQTYTLRDLDERSLQVLRTRRDIACVLVNPLQALHPNANAPSDGQLVATRRPAAAGRDRYAHWLQQLRQVCDERGIVLILDEVFLGFRLARGGAQAYYGVQADLVTYGKTLGGGLPVGVVCGQRRLMKRWRDDRPADICFARGTFNAHPMVMAAMNAFLRRLDTPAIGALYHDLDARWDARAARLNAALAAAQLPVRVSHLSSIWTVQYTEPSRYHWMLAYYLRLHGLALSWVGTGRLIFTLDLDDAGFETIVQRFTAAATQMRDDGWWWRDERLTDRAIRRTLLREVWQAWRRG